MEVSVLARPKNEVVHVQFNMKSISFIEFIIITIFIDQIKFHVVKIDTFFLLCLVDLNRLNVYYNNINDILIQIHKQLIISVICRFEHSFLL